MGKRGEWTMYIEKEIHTGYNPYLIMGEDDQNTGLDVGLLVLEDGQTWTSNEAEKEVAILLLEGCVDFAWEGKTVSAQRKDCIHAEAYCLHLGRGVEATVTAKGHAELYIQRTDNENAFPSRMYTPEDIMVQHAGDKGELLGCMRREIKTFFDYESAPWSNMVLGEVLNFPGKWSSYPPHHHPQPEVYFHRFDRPQGFGASFANGEVYTSHHNGLTIINHGFHSQAAAPGYAMCYMWGIRHLPGDPWRKTRIDDEEHTWLLKEDVNKEIFHSGEE